MRPRPMRPDLTSLRALAVSLALVKGAAAVVNGVPMSFEVGGKQYVAVQTGWGVDATRVQSRLNLVRPGAYPEVPQGGSIWVFAVE